MKKVLYIFLLTGLFNLTACSDFLEPDSSTEYTPTEISSLEEMLLAESYPKRISSPFFGFTSCLDDDLTARPYVNLINSATNTNEYDEARIRASKTLYSWTENYGAVLKEMDALGYYSVELYADIYKLIVGANAALDYVDNMLGTNNELCNVRAQAYALRGFHYFQLTNLYGTPYNSHPNGLGVPLKLTSKLEEGKQVRKTVAECYTQILSDFLNAETNYKEMGSAHKWKKNYRTSLAMVRLMLSRVYLYMENWENAAKYAKLVMDDPAFSLINLIGYPKPTQSTANLVEYVNLISYSMPETIWLYGSVHDGFSTISLTTNNSTAKLKNIALFNASQDLLNSYGELLSADEEDYRLSHYIVEEYKENGTELKRAYGKIKVSDYTQGRSPISTDIEVFGHALRLSEAYLNYAEAKAMIAKADDAILALNKLRSTRITNYHPLTSASFANADALVNFVRNERRRELCYEGHRWFDLRRYGMPKIEHKWFDQYNQQVPIVSTLVGEKSFYAIPIPQSMLESNSALDPNTWQ